MPPYLIRAKFDEVMSSIYDELEATYDCFYCHCTNIGRNCGGLCHGSFHQWRNSRHFPRLESVGPNSEDVRKLLVEFDTTIRTLLRDLEDLRKRSEPLTEEAQA